MTRSRAALNSSDRGGKPRSVPRGPSRKTICFLMPRHGVPESGCPWLRGKQGKHQLPHGRVEPMGQDWVLSLCPLLIRQVVGLALRPASSSAMLRAPLLCRSQYRRRVRQPHSRMVAPGLRPCRSAALEVRRSLTGTPLNSLEWSRRDDTGTLRGRMNCPHLGLPVQGSGSPRFLWVSQVAIKTPDRAGGRHRRGS